MRATATQKSTGSSAWIRSAGLLAIAGGLINAVSDYLLQGGLIARDAVNTYVNLPAAPFDLVFLGSIIGNAAIPLWLFGFLPVFVALAPAGRWWAVPPTLLLSYVFALFPGYHGAYALYAAGFQAERAAPAASLGVLKLMSSRLHDYHDALLGVIGLCSLTGGLWLAAAILSGRTRYARWMVLFTPLVVPLTQPLVEMLPAPVGGYVRPAWGTLLFSVFFFLSMVVTWNVRIRLSTEARDNWS